MGVTCRACRDAARPAMRVLDASLATPSAHPAVVDSDALGNLWDAVWVAFDDQVAAWPLGRVLTELPLRDDMATALDRHLVESDPSLATGDDMVRGALVRSLVDEYVNQWVLAHA